MKLTAMEQYILECLASDYTIDDICLEFNSSLLAITKYLTRIKYKLGIKSLVAKITTHDELCSMAKAHFSKTVYYLSLKD